MHWPFQGPLGQFSEKSFQFAQESVGQNPSQFMRTPRKPEGHSLAMAVLGPFKET